jgi:hypothetical protein
VKPVLALAALMMTAAPAEACHRFARWHYPWPQRCGVQRHVAGLVTPVSFEAPLPAPRPDAAEFPLPDMAGIWDAAADDETRARLIAIVKLREQMNR